MTDEAKEREAFEKWAYDLMGRSISQWPPSPQAYFHNDTAWAWKGWLARAEMESEK